MIFRGDILNKVIEINRKSSFTLHEVRTILPLFYTLTEQAQKEVRGLSNRIHAYSDETHPAVAPIEEKINEIVERWQDKISKLGGKPKGLWLVDFDNGDGYYCWRYPETEIKYWHGYQDGFSGRIMI